MHLGFVTWWVDLSMATSGPAKITLTSDDSNESLLQRFIYSYLQKRPFILRSNTATMQQKIRVCPSTVPMECIARC